jgi:integrase
VALGTGLREHEIAALDVGDVLHEDGRVRRRITLRTFKRSSTEPATLLWEHTGTKLLGSGAE